MVDVLDPDVDALSIVDIARGLALQCRYGGQVRWPFSIAQHSCLLVDHAVAALDATPVEALQVLCHDASEAYLCDLPKPVKHCGKLAAYKQIELRFEAVIADWLNLPAEPPVWLKRIDTDICVDERLALCPGYVADGSPLGIKIEPWSWHRAEREFMNRFTALTQPFYPRWHALPRQVSHGRVEALN